MKFGIIQVCEAYYSVALQKAMEQLDGRTPITMSHAIRQASEIVSEAHFITILYSEATGE